MLKPIGTTVLKSGNQTRTAAQADAANTLNELQMSISRLYLQVQTLKQNRSDDKVQQMQTDAIVELFKSVSWIQRILWPTVEQLMLGGGNFDAAREAAKAAGGNGGGTGGAAATLSAASVKATAASALTTAALLKRP